MPAPRVRGRSPHRGPGLLLPLPRLVVRRRGAEARRSFAARSRHARHQDRGRLRPRRVPAVRPGDAREGAGRVMGLPRRVADWLDERTEEWRAAARGWIEHPVVGGAPWASAMAASVATCFAVLALTGLTLMTAYGASPQAAWASVHYVQFVQERGWVVRGLHFWAAQSLLVLAAVHRRARRVRRELPKAAREVAWWLTLGVLGPRGGRGDHGRPPALGRARLVGSRHRGEHRRAGPGPHGAGGPDGGLRPGQAATVAPDDALRAPATSSTAPASSFGTTLIPWPRAPTSRCSRGSTARAGRAPSS